MRRTIAERHVKAGQTVRLSIRLGDGQKFARVGLWSAAPGTDDYSPDCPVVPDDNGLPVMVQPRRWSLDYRGRKTVTLEWIAADAINLRIVQDVDTASEAAPIAGLKSHGPGYEAIRRFVARVGRRLRRDHDAPRRASA